MYPSSFNAYNGNRPMVSPYLKLIWVPIMGCVPTFDNFSANSKAPHKFVVSDKPKDLILFSLEKSFKSSIFIAPSHIENCVWTLTWLNVKKGVALFSGTINGLFGQLFNKGKHNDVKELYSKLKSKFKDTFYIEIQRHGDQNEVGFEKFNLSKSLELEIPLIATHEVFYINKYMHEAHDALICIKNKTYINEKNRKKYSNQHYLKNNTEMSELFVDLPKH